MIVQDLTLNTLGAKPCTDTYAYCGGRRDMDIVSTESGHFVQRYCIAPAFTY
jgi:hypothetical protein